MEGVVTVTPVAATAQPGAVGRPESQDGSNYSLTVEPRPPHSLVPEAQDLLGNSFSSTGPPVPGTEDQGGGISNKMGIPSGGSHIRDQTGQKLGQVPLKTSGSDIIV